ncbi:MAG TPA: hypothetical protein VK864_05450 [Longimicrobiales bacterium]|nr:hypothetical protein [Longimicrobiales bacterium]
MDPANPIVRLCVQGMEAEFRGDFANLGHSCELLDRRDEAYAFYSKAAEVVSQLPEGSYGDTVRSAIHAGFTRSKEARA